MSHTLDLASVRDCRAIPELHTFLFAGRAGFTALPEAHGDEQAADIANEFSRATAELLPLHGAEQIKTIGDALMLRVDRPGEAGSAVHRAGDWFGATVKVAARVSGSPSQ